MHFLFSSVCVCSLKKKLYLYDCLAFRYKSRVLFLTCFPFVLLLCLCGFSSCSLRRNGFCFFFSEFKCLAGILVRFGSIWNHWSIFGYCLGKVKLGSVLVVNMVWEKHCRKSWLVWVSLNKFWNCSQLRLLTNMNVCVCLCIVCFLTIWKITFI